MSLKAGEQQLASETRGSVAIITALAISAMMMAVGVALDYGYLSTQKNNLQTAVDSAAVAAARELHLANATGSQIESVAKRVLEINLGDVAKKIRVKIDIDQDAFLVNVAAETEPDTLFMQKFAPDAISASASAKLRGGSPLCVLGLNETSIATVALNDNGELTAPDCAVYSNSIHKNGLVAKTGAIMQAEFICAAGGTAGGKGSYSPNPVVDCPPLEDPLLKHPAPDYGACDEKGFMIGVDLNNLPTPKSYKDSVKQEYFDETTMLLSDTSSPSISDSPKIDPTTPKMDVVLKPGVYCGGVIIGGNTRVYFEPGVYIMKDGPFFITDSAEVTAVNAGFYLTGKRAIFTLGPDTTIDMSAPNEGPMAGLLFFEDRNNGAGRTHSIMSDDARFLVGTIYLPRGELFVDSDKPIADQSAYTSIIAQRLWLLQGPKLVLNTDYDATSVPVPASVRHSGWVTLFE